MADRFLPSNINISLKDLIRHYHWIKPKLKYKDICSVISTHHNRRPTPNMLKQICKLEGLTRRRNVTEDQLYDIIVNELGTSLHTVGYRQMTENVCIKYNINVSKEDVRKAVKIVNPEGVEERKRNSIKRRLYRAKGPADI